MADQGAQPETGAAGGFDPLAFRRALVTYFWGAYLLFLPAVVMFFLPAETLQRINGFTMGGVPVVALGGFYGLVAFQGVCVGLVAVGGCAAGVVAVGGGAVGGLAIGGGAVGIVAMGGGAVGYYAIGGDAWGKHCLSYRRQDAEAVEFFCRYLPRLRKAFPTRGQAS